MTTSNTSTSCRAPVKEKEEKGVSLEEFVRTAYWRSQGGRVRAYCVLAKSRAIGKTKKKGKGPQDRQWGRG